MAMITATIGPKFGHHQDRVELPKRRATEYDEYSRSSSSDNTTNYAAVYSVGSL